MTDAANPPVTSPQADVTGVVTPKFKLLFCAVLGLTVFSMLLNVGMVIWADVEKDAVKGVIDSCSTTWKMGFGAIIGLVGG